MELIKKDATTTRFYKDKHGETNRILSEDEVQALAHEQELATKKYRRNWLNQIEDETVPPVLLRARQFKDPELMFLTRPQRLRLEHIVNGSYLARQQEGATAGKPAPFWSLAYTDEALIRYCDDTGARWDGPRGREENAAELRKHSGTAFKTTDYFLSREHRRELELQVELGFKRNMPNIRMPQLSLRYTDKTLLELAGSIDGLLTAKIPTKPPREVLKRSKAQVIPGAGPGSAADFEVFVEPIVEEYFRALPASGAVVTLLLNGEVALSRGFGHSGRMDKLARDERRAKKEAQRQAKRRARELRNAEAADIAAAEERARVEEALRLEAEELRAMGYKTEEEIAREAKVRALFHAVDKDGSGSVTPEELRGGMAAYGLDPEQDTVFAKVLEEADEDGDGQVTLDEFVAAFEGEGGVDADEQALLDAMEKTEKENPTRRRIRAIFGAMDDDNSGFVTAHELREGLEQLGVEPDGGDMENLLMEMDTDGDGRVGVTEFIKAFKKLGVEKTLEKERKRRKRRRIKAAARTRHLAWLFEEFDTNRDGVVDTRELWEGCHRFGLTPDVEQIKLMVERADGGHDGAGHLKINDFLLMFEGVEGESPVPPEQVGWAKVERPIKKIELLMRRGQYEGALNTLSQVATELPPAPPNARRGSVASYDSYYTTPGMVDEDPEPEEVDPATSTASFLALREMLGPKRAERQRRLVADYEQGLRRWLEDKLEVLPDSSEDSDEEAERLQKAKDAEAEAAAAQSEKERRKRAQRMFKQIDADGSGHLNREEVRGLASAMEIEMGEKELGVAMDELDPDGSGEITFEEFYLWWHRQEEGGGKDAGGEGGGGLFGRSIAGTKIRRAGGNDMEAKEREGTLRVRVVQGRGLPRMDNDSGGADPYCTLVYGSSAFKTKTRKNTLKPIWGEAFAFQVHDSEEDFVLQLYDADPLDADDLIGEVRFTPEQVLKGDEDSKAGERWWTVEHARGGVDLEEVAVDFSRMGASDLQEALQERGLSTDGPDDWKEKGEVFRARLQDRGEGGGGGFGELLLVAAFYEEGEDEGGWDDDDDPEDTDSDEDELWEAVAEEMAGGRRPLDCKTKHMLQDVRGGELPADGWTKDEEKKLAAAVKKFAEPVSADLTMVPVGGVSRVVTAMAAIQLAEQGNLDLEADINTITTVDVIRHKHAKTLGSGKGTDELPPALTAAQLLTGCSGLDHKWTGIGGNGQAERFTGQRDPTWRLSARASCGCGCASVITLLLLGMLGGPTAWRQPVSSGTYVPVDDAGSAADPDCPTGCLTDEQVTEWQDEGGAAPEVEGEGEGPLTILLRLVCVLGVLLCVVGTPLFTRLHRKYAEVPDWYCSTLRRYFFPEKTLEETANQMRKPVLGQWLEMYFPAVVYPPGTMPGCPMYGYALLGHAIEAKANRPFWHHVHYKILKPLGLHATSFGGPHLPDPGPDAAEQQRQYAELERLAATRAREMDAMVAEIDNVKEQLRLEDDPKEKRRRAKAGSLSLVGNPRLKLAKLERSHATRYEQLEEARQQDDEKREAMEEADRLSLVAVAGCLPQPRPESWKGVWPPRRWQGHTSHPPFLPTKLWNHGPKKFKPPDPSQVRTSAATSTLEMRDRQKVRCCATVLFVHSGWMAEHRRRFRRDEPQRLHENDGTIVAQQGGATGLPCLLPMLCVCRQWL